MLQGGTMERLNAIIRDPFFIENLRKTNEREKERIFCRHGLDHLIDAARVLYILVLEDRLEVSRETAYAAAFLHDLGRWVEYDTGRDHAEASAELSERLLDEHGFKGTEKEIILLAIRGHRVKGAVGILTDAMYRADKLSRPCMNCLSISMCKRFSHGETAEIEY